MEARTTSTHYVTPGRKWLTVALVPILVALLAWGATEIVKNYSSGKGDPNIWVTGLVLALLGSLIVVFLASVPWAFRARVVLTRDSMTVRGLIRTRVITEAEIEGFRWINGQLHLYLKNREWPIQLSHYQDPYAINAWVFAHARDLAQQELAQEDVAIKRDLSLGMTERQKEDQLARLRKIVKSINVLAYGVAAVGVINVLFLEQDMIAKTATGVLVAIPILLDLLALRNRGHIRIDYQEGTRYPQIFSGTLACGIAVALMSLFDKTTLLGNEFYRWLIPIALAKGLLWLYIDLDRLRMLHARSRFAPAVTAVSLMLLPAFWVGGSLYQVNQHFDNSSVSWNATEVLSTRRSSGKTVTYYAKVKPWSPSLDEPPELVMSRQQFEQLKVGMHVEVGVREGALALPWVAEIRIENNKAREEGQSTSLPGARVFSGSDAAYQD
jgi:hypothetical protein